MAKFELWDGETDTFEELDEFNETGDETWVSAHALLDSGGEGSLLRTLGPNLDHERFWSGGFIETGDIVLLASLFAFSRVGLGCSMFNLLNWSVFLLLTKNDVEDGDDEFDDGDDDDDGDEFECIFGLGGSSTRDKSEAVRLVEVTMLFIEFWFSVSSLL